MTGAFQRVGGRCEPIRMVTRRNSECFGESRLRENLGTDIGSFPQQYFVYCKGMQRSLGGKDPPRDEDDRQRREPLQGAVPDSTGVVRQDKRAEAPGLSKTGNFFKLTDNNNVALAA